MYFQGAKEEEEMPIRRMVSFLNPSCDSRVKRDHHHFDIFPDDRILLDGLIFQFQFSITQ